MSGKSLKAQARGLGIAPGSRHAIVQKLVIDGVLDRPRSSAELVLLIQETFGQKWRTIHVQTYMKKFLLAGIIRAVKTPHGQHNFWVLASVPKEDALKTIGKTQKIMDIEENLFSRELTKRLAKDFGRELEELHDNFGKNGNCSAFLLRKILEKLIIVAVSKNGGEHLLRDSGRPGGWKGLKDMIDIAAREKISGIPILIPKTANEIKGLKFLGDTAAHNPLVGVDMATIIPQMPYVITAYKELAERL
jgi:hypothetical protein